MTPIRRITAALATLGGALGECIGRALHGATICAGQLKRVADTRWAMSTPPLRG